MVESDILKTFDKLVEVVVHLKEVAENNRKIQQLQSEQLRLHKEMIKTLTKRIELLELQSKYRR